MDECLRGLLELDRDSLSLVASFLPGGDEVARAAALALADSHLPAAFAYLRDALEQSQRESMAQALLLAMALLRTEEALEFLMQQISDGNEERYYDTLAALSVYDGDAQLQERIRAAEARRETIAARPARTRFRR